MNKINLESVFAINLTYKQERVEELNKLIKEWKAEQVKHSDSNFAIRYYSDLVIRANRELERLGA